MNIWSPVVVMSECLDHSTSGCLDVRMPQFCGLWISRCVDVLLSKCLRVSVSMDVQMSGCVGV